MFKFWYRFIANNVIKLKRVLEIFRKEMMTMNFRKLWIAWMLLLLNTIILASCTLPNQAPSNNGATLKEPETVTTNTKPPDQRILKIVLPNGEQSLVIGEGIDEAKIKRLFGEPVNMQSNKEEDERGIREYKDYLFKDTEVQTVRIDQKGDFSLLAIHFTNPNIKTFQGITTGDSKAKLKDALKPIKMKSVMDGETISAEAMLTEPEEGLIQWSLGNGMWALDPANTVEAGGINYYFKDNAISKISVWQWP